MQRIAIVLAGLTILVASAPPGSALLPGADADGDGVPDAVENLLGSSQYIATDTPAAIGLNAIVNPGFELQAEAVAEATTCPVFGDYNVLVAGFAYVTPCYSSALRSTGWSTQQLSAGQEAITAQPMDFDGDGDLEMVVPRVTLNSHSFYQSFANPQQAFSGDFAAFTFDLESGALDNAGTVILSLSRTPFADPNEWLLLYVDCGLAITPALIASHATPFDGPDGRTYHHVSIDPAEVLMFPYWTGCQATADAYNAASTAERHALLGPMRLVQTSFWSFNGQVVDNVDVRFARPVTPAGVDLPG